MSKKLHPWWLSLCFCIASSLPPTPAANCQHLNHAEYSTYQCGNQPKDGQIWVKISPDGEIEITCSTYDKSDYISLISGQEISPNVALERLVISQCPVPDVSFRQFSKILNITTMRILNFSSNWPFWKGDFKAYHFENLESVEVLNLKANVSELPERVFDEMRNLKELNLAGNRLRRLPEELFEPVGELRELDLQSNDFTSLDGNFLRYVPNLTRLNLCDNRLEGISKSIFDSLTSLTILELCNNSITYLENGVLDNLKNLEEINLANNKLTNISAHLFDECVNLRVLQLNGNLLRVLPNHIFLYNWNLVKLDISNNRLETLKEFLLYPLIKLSVLRLDENQISDINRDIFYSLSSLTELNLSRNELKNLSRRTFLDLISLETLDLSYNQLTLEEAAIGQLSPLTACVNLRNLNLSHNLLKKVFVDWRMILSNLQQLDLSFNKLEDLTTEDFMFNASNATIDFSNNPLRTIDMDHLEHKVQPPCSQSDFFLKNYSNKKSQKNNFNLENTLIKCDCHALSLAKYFQKRMDPAVYKRVNLSMNRINCQFNDTKKTTSLGNVSIRELKCPLKELYPEEAKNCPDRCDCHYRSFDHANIVNCSGTKMEKFPIKIPIIKDAKIQLLFSKNKFKSVEGLSKLSMMGNVTVISLSGNELKSIDDLQLPSTIESFRLDNNKISHLSKNTIDFFRKTTSLRNLTLMGNPWECNCETRDFQSFLRLHRQTLWIHNLTHITCKNSNHPVIDVWEEKLCPSTFVVLFKYIAILGLTSIPCIVLYYKYKRKIKMWMFTHKICLWLVTEKEIDKDKLYDAFVSFSHKDQHFVDEQLIPELEENGEHKFKLCVHHRDFVIGEYIPNQIGYSVENSRRTIIILTPNFLRSIWARMEFRMAHLQAIKERCARVIVILLEDVNNEELDPELKSYIAMNTYVKWDDSAFWQKLRYALPHPPIKYKKNRKAGRRIFQEIEMREMPKD